MSKESKALLKKNNQREEAILEENDEIYTNMVVYLRAADITEYHQEIVREDIINMILEGQKRGDNIQTVMGSNYKEICDEIIEALPKKTKTEKIMDIVKMTLLITWILGIIAVIKNVIYHVASKESDWIFTMTAGEIVNWLLIAVISNAVVLYICKNAFEETKTNNKVISFLKLWLICMLIIAVMAGSVYFLNMVLIKVSIISATAFFALVFVIEKMLSRKY